MIYNSDTFAKQIFTKRIQNDDNIVKESKMMINVMCFPLLLLLFFTVCCYVCCVATAINIIGSLLFHVSSDVNCKALPIRVVTSLLLRNYSDAYCSCNQRYWLNVIQHNKADGLEKKKHHGTGMKRRRLRGMLSYTV